MIVKSREMVAIYHSETLCSHTVLDKVLTGKKKAAIVKRMSSPNTLLAQIAFLHDSPDMLVSFNMSPLPLAFFLLPTESGRCLSAWTINKISVGRRATKTSASRCCNIICLRWQWVFKWKTCEVSAFKYLSQTACRVKTIGRHMKVWARTHTHTHRGQITPGQMGTVG